MKRIRELLHDVGDDLPVSPSRVEPRSEPPAWETPR
jgi:hypothetical protein